MMRALFTERYSRTEHNVFSKIPFNKTSHYIATSQFIYIANQLTGFCKAQVSIEKHFRTYTTVCSQIHFSKNSTIEKPANISLMVINWMDFIWYEVTLKGIFEQTLSQGHLLVKLSLAPLFNSHWHDYSTIAGTIVQQSLVRFFNSHWNNSSTVTGTILQQSLAWVSSSGWHDSLTVTGKILSFFYDCRILQQWCSLLKNRAMYQQYDIWSTKPYLKSNILKKKQYYCFGTVLFLTNCIFFVHWLSNLVSNIT